MIQQALSRTFVAVLAASVLGCTAAGGEAGGEPDVVVDAGGPRDRDPTADASGTASDASIPSRDASGAAGDACEHYSVQPGYDADLGVPGRVGETLDELLYRYRSTSPYTTEVLSSTTSGLCAIEEFNTSNGLSRYRVTKTECPAGEFTLAVTSSIEGYDYDTSMLTGVFYPQGRAFYRGNSDRVVEEQIETFDEDIQGYMMHRIRYDNDGDGLADTFSWFLPSYGPNSMRQYCEADEVPLSVRYDSQTGSRVHEGEVLAGRIVCDETHPTAIAEMFTCLRYED